MAHQALSKRRISVVVPAYNESEVISASLRELLPFLQSSYVDFELIVVDDGSTDQTRNLLVSFADSAPDIRLIFNQHNLGRGNALKRAFGAASGQILAYVDADLPFNLEILRAGVTYIENGFDLAIGSKYAPGATFSAPATRKLLGRTYASLARLMLGIRLYDCQGGLKVFKRSLLDSLLPQVTDNRWGWDTELVAKAWLGGFRITEMPAASRSMWHRKSRVKVMKDSFSLLLHLIRLRKQVRRAKESGKRTSE